MIVPADVFSENCLVEIFSDALNNLLSNSGEENHTARLTKAEKHTAK
jgi:hypothetical protein